MAIRNALNLEKQFSFYASYHRQPVNVAIHLLCIWPILATALLRLQVYLKCVKKMDNKPLPIEFSTQNVKHHSVILYNPFAFSLF